MFNIFKKISFEKLMTLVVEIFKRFPLPAILSIVSFFIMVSIIRFSDTMSNSTEEMLLKLFTTLVISFFFSTAIYLYTESKMFDLARNQYYQLASFVFASLFYYFFDEGLFSGYEAETVVYIVLTILGVIAFLFIARYFEKFVLKIISQSEFYVSSYTLVIEILMSAIVGIVTMLLGFIALSSIFTLFDIKFLDDNNWYGYWAIFSLVFFAPFFFLGNIPKKETNNVIKIEEVSSNKFYSFLINYVGLPAIFIYFIILYAYTVKVLVNFSEWPQGEVSWMVILFSFFGYLIYFASFAFRETFKVVKFFRKILPIAVILQTPMLFYAIGLRINQYDLTINRYLVLVFGFWLLFLSAYYIISRKKDLSMFFYSLLVVVIFMSIGPWSVYLVPEWRQLNQLENNLVKANILQESKIVALSSARDIEAKLSGEIYGGIDYLCNYHGCKTLDNLFFDEIKVIKTKDREDFDKSKIEQVEIAEKNKDEELLKNIKDDEYDEISNWELINELTKYLKVERWDSYNLEQNLEYLRFDSDIRLNYFNPSTAVKGYDYYIPLLSLDFENNIKGNQDNQDNQYYATIDSEEAKFRLYLKHNQLEEIDISNSIIQQILSKKDKYIKPENSDRGLEALLPNEDMTFDIVGENYEMRINIKSISLKNPEWVEQDLEDYGGVRPTTKTIPRYVDGYVLIREKDKTLDLLKE